MLSLPFSLAIFVLAFCCLVVVHPPPVLLCVYPPPCFHPFLSPACFAPIFPPPFLLPRFVSSLVGPVPCCVSMFLYLCHRASFLALLSLCSAVTCDHTMRTSIVSFRWKQINVLELLLWLKKRIKYRHVSHDTHFEYSMCCTKECTRQDNQNRGSGVRKVAESPRAPLCARPCQQPSQSLQKSGCRVHREL